MHQMEFAPFRGSERTEDGMVRERLAAAEAGLAVLDDAVQS